MSIQLVTDGMLQYFMSKYTPSDEIIIELDVDEIDGTIEDEIAGDLKECE